MSRIIDTSVEKSTHYVESPPELVEQSAGSGLEDDIDINHLGYKAELQRRFGLRSMIGYSSANMITWEGLLFLFTYGLENGGPAGLIYGFIFCWLGFVCVCLSLGELASMTPTAAGQYHWVWELAPARYRKFLSYITAFQNVLAWQTCLASASYLGGTTIQGLAILNYPDYAPARWQGTLILYALLLIAAVINTLLVRLLPMIEGSILVLHIVGFFVMLIALTYLGPHAEAKDVFANFLTLGGYSPGLSFFVGLMTTVFAFVGADGVIHMSEEAQDAKRTVPKALAWSIMINGALGFAFMIVILFCIGDIDAALATPTGFPFLEIFDQALRSTRFATGLASLIVTMCIAAVVAELAAASRVTWAFARDDGLPGSWLLKKVHSRTKLPLWSIGTSVLISMLLGLINIGSATAFNAVLSSTIAAYFGSYMVPIALLAYRRRSPRSHLTLGPWNLGRYGFAVNVFAVAWLCLMFVFSFFPQVVPVTAASMNWACLLWGAAIISGVLFYYKQRKVFTGPRAMHGSMQVQQ